MSFTKIWIHSVWSTKNKEPIISSDLRGKLITHFKENAIKKDIYLREINCVSEHVHALLLLQRDKTLSKIIQLLKGESSFWINQNKLTKSKFLWQDDYFAVSVSPSQLKNVIRYIKNQQEHHKKNSFSEEYDEFVTKYEGLYG